MNSKLNIIFPGMEHIFMPVIHMDEKAIAFMNAKIAFDCGADGVWLISHDLRPEEFVKNSLEIKRLMPDKWIGLNILRASKNETLELFPKEMDGLWIDNIGLTDKSSAAAVIFMSEYYSKFKDKVLFGGVAFKHQPEVINLVDIVREARHVCDVITTSGVKTGEPPTIEKMITVHKEAAGIPVAIASGMNPENVKEFMPYAEYFLVSTGISKDFYNLDHIKTRAFARVLGK